MEIDKNNKIYPKVETDFGWRRNLEFIKEQFILMLKRAVEYKSNFYSSFLIQFIYYLSMFLFFGILSSEFGGLITWTKADLILYTLLTSIIFAISGLFLWKDSLFGLASRGTLNTFLTKPINTFLFYTCFEIEPAALIFIIIDIIFLFILKIYFQIEFFNIFLSLIIFLLIVLLYLVVYMFILSLDLIKLGITNSFLQSYNRTFQFFETYPITFFKQAPFKLLLLFIFPIVFIGSLLMPLLRGYEFMFDPYLQVGIILGLIIIFGVGTWINWHYGLKKYEAFG